MVLDSGIRSGQDVMRALALGAKAAFAGKSFLWSLGALGDAGPAHLIDLYIDELRSSLGQIGARSLDRGAPCGDAAIPAPGASTGTISAHIPRPGQVCITALRLRAVAIRPHRR